MNEFICDNCHESAPSSGEYYCDCCRMMHEPFDPECLCVMTIGDDK